MSGEKHCMTRSAWPTRERDKEEGEATVCGILQRWK